MLSTDRPKRAVLYVRVSTEEQASRVTRYRISSES
jgi:DNA invertase Pin-like site-specific DNA recombinase